MVHIAHFDTKFHYIEAYPAFGQHILCASSLNGSTFVQVNFAANTRIHRRTFNMQGMGVMVFWVDYLIFNMDHGNAYYYWKVTNHHVITFNWGKCRILKGELSGIFNCTSLSIFP